MQGTLIAIVMDRSGSMSSSKEDAEGGLNQFIEDQKAVPGLCLVTLTQFDTEYNVVFAATPVTEVKKIKLHPRGMTALLDAVGKTIGQVESDLAALPESERPSQVIFVIVTDGHENSSHEWTKDKLKQAIADKEGDGWQFTFIGADIDAFGTSAGLGLRAGSTLQTNNRNFGNAYAATSSAMTRSRLTTTVMEYDADERAKAVSNA